MSYSSDVSAIELKTITPLEKVRKKVREFATLVIGNRVEADEFVEDAMILFLATDPEPAEVEESFAYLITAVRRLMRTSGARLKHGCDLDSALAPLLQLPLDVREIAALHLGAGLCVPNTASLLGLAPEEATVGLLVARGAIGGEAYDKAAPQIAGLES